MHFDLAKNIYSGRIESPSCTWNRKLFYCRGVEKDISHVHINIEGAAQDVLLFIVFVMRTPSQVEREETSPTTGLGKRALNYKSESMFTFNAVKGHFCVFFLLLSHTESDYNIAVWEVFFFILREL